MTTLSAIRALLFDGARPGRLPQGVAALAVRHRCGVPLYERLRGAGLRESVSDADWRLLRAYAHYQRVRAEFVRSLLNSAARASLDKWFVWKGGALLLLVDRYEFEAADIDIGATSAGVDAWCEWMAQQGADLSKRHFVGGRLRAFQARVRVQAGEDPPMVVLDVKTVDTLPPLDAVEGVPVPAAEWHLWQLEEHAAKHRDEYDGARLRMFYDAGLLGAPWSAEMSRALESDEASHS